MTEFYSVFQDWENQNVDGYVSKWPKELSDKVPITDPKYAEELEQVGRKVCIAISVAHFLILRIARPNTTEHSSSSSRGLGYCRWVIRFVIITVGDS